LLCPIKIAGVLTGNVAADANVL